MIGRGEWIRTTDLTVPNRALYQAEPRPDKKCNLDSRERIRLCQRASISDSGVRADYISSELANEG